MNFKEFLSQEPPSKACGYINRKGTIHYESNACGWIKFNRINLDGSCKNSYWELDVPAWHNQRVREALRIWALNMPEHYTDDVNVSKVGVPLGTTTVENLANFKFDLQRPCSIAIVLKVI